MGRVDQWHGGIMSCDLMSLVNCTHPWRREKGPYCQHCVSFILGAPSKDPCHPDYAPSAFAHNKTTDGSQKLERYQGRKSRSSLVVESIVPPPTEVPNANSEEGCPPEVPYADPERSIATGTELCNHFCTQFITFYGHKSSKNRVFQCITFYDVIWPCRNPENYWDCTIYQF